jgi:hypothetical protein
MLTETDRSTKMNWPTSQRNGAATVTQAAAPSVAKMAAAAQRVVDREAAAQRGVERAVLAAQVGPADRVAIMVLPARNEWSNTPLSLTPTMMDN